MTFIVGLVGLICLNLLLGAALFGALDLSGGYLVPWGGYCCASGWVWAAAAEGLDP